MRNPTHFEVAAVACGLLLGCLTLPSSASPSLGDAARRAKAIETYEHALRLRTRLHSRPEGRRPIGAYLKLIQTFQAVYRLDPAYAGSPAALADAAALYREVGRQFSDDRYYRAAIKSSNLLITAYPRSLLSRDALLTIGEIYASDLNQPDDARRVYKKFL